MLVSATLGDDQIPMATDDLLEALGRLRDQQGRTLLLINEPETILTIAAGPGLGYYVSYLDSEAEWLAYRGDLAGDKVTTTFAGNSDPIPKALLVPESAARAAVRAFAEANRRSEAVRWVTCSELLKKSF